MGISLSQGPYQYNRFDDYEARIKSLEEKSSYMKKQDEEEADYEDEEEDKGAGSPAKMAKSVKEEGKKSKKSSDKDEEESEDEEKKEEKDSLEEAHLHELNLERLRNAERARQQTKAKKAEKEEKNEKAAARAEVKVGKQAVAHNVAKAKAEEKEKQQKDQRKRMSKADLSRVPAKNRIEEEAATAENMARRAMNKAPNSTKEKVQAKVMENHQMDSYVRALGRMGATYDIHEKEEVAQEQLEESTLGMGLVTPVLAGKSPDQQETPEVESETAITKEVVLEFLVNENYATNAVSAEAMFHHMSDDFLLVIEGLIAESSAE